MSAPNWGYTDACTSGALHAVLKWNLESGTQNGYEIVVNTSSSSAVSTSSAACWSGVKNPAIASQYVIPNSDPNCQTLNYNTNYYWWVRLYDATGTTTQWYQYGANDGHNGTHDSQTNGDPGVSKTFKTYQHEFPTPLFSSTPPFEEILVGTSTAFTSAGSQFYTAASPTSPQSCYSPACHYLWATNDSGAIISNATAATTTIIFQHATGTTAFLSVTDNDNYVCSLSASLVVNFNLPLWREVKAQ